MQLKSKIKTIMFIVIVLCVGLISFTILADHFSDPGTYSDTIQSLDDKRNDVLAMSAASASVSTALTIIPGDVAEPLANELADLSSTLMIVLCAIFMEKYMLTLAGILAFRLLIPAACILLVAFIFTRREVFRKYACKMILLGICIVLLVPASTWTTNFIEDTYSVSIQQNVDEANQTADLLNKNSDDDNILTKLFKKVKSGASNLYDKTKEILGNFIEAAAILIITSCVIPILTLLLFIWIINMILGLSINVPVRKLNVLARSGSKLRSKALSKKSVNE